MDIKISNVDPMYVKEIDKKAKELSKNLGKKISRNEYIKRLIQNDCELNFIKLKEDKYDHAIEFLTVTLARQENTIQSFIESNTKLFNLIASGKSLAEGVDEL